MSKFLDREIKPLTSIILIAVITAGILYLLFLFIEWNYSFYVHAMHTIKPSETPFDTYFPILPKYIADIYDPINFFIQYNWAWIKVKYLGGSI